MEEKEIIRTNYFDQLKSWLKSPVIKVITGMRRTGKSTILKQWAEFLVKNDLCSVENMFFLECDSLENIELTNFRELTERIKPYKKKPGYKFLLIDEIQNISEWEKVIAALHKENDWDIYITGSNSTLLSGELATRLSGRYVQLEISAFSYLEHLTILKKSHSPEIFQQYLNHGGLPVLYHIAEEEFLKIQILDSIHHTIVLKDIVERYSLRNTALLEKIIQYFFDNIGNISNAKRIADYCKSQKISVGVETVQNYASYLESCYVIHRVKRHDLKGRKILEVNEKIYVNDHGLRNAVLRRKTQDIGALLENIVYIELRRRHYSITVGYAGNYEIDFVAEKNNSRIYIQVCYLLSSPETMEREFRALEVIEDNYPKFVLSMDLMDFSRNGIKHGFLPDWLQYKAVPAEINKNL